MIYQDFIQSIEQQGSKSIKALNVDGSCSTRQVPDEILHLLPDIIKLLEKNLYLCHREQVMVLFGLQPCTITIQSHFPIKHKRIFNLKNPYMHLCCVLQYFLAYKNFSSHDFNEKKKQNLIIDFTTGLIMDNQLYLSKIFASPTQGLLYGSLNQLALKGVWAKISKNETKLFKESL